MRRHILHLIFFLFLSLSLTFPIVGLASSVSVSPPSGVFSTGSTFDVPILLDTKGKSINAVQIFLSFPPDKLQVVSPSTGHSVVDVWTVPPKYDNTKGTVSLEGGIPGGIITTRGILTTITFRVKTVGTAIVRVLENSKVYLNDGLATPDLGYTTSAIYELRLPPPLGPAVVSDTHPDQTTWYPDNTAIIRFQNSLPVTGYSYVLSDDPTTVPDNISEGFRTSITYNNMSDGLHYFNIKALRDGVWGGTTHFALRVDTTSPALFPIDVLPSAHTTSTKPVIQFTTTDVSSGVDHYEIKVEPLSPEALKSGDIGAQNFFVESTSPFITSPLVIGSYNVVIRAYDKATNYREVTKRLIITTPLFRFISDQGLVINNKLTIPWVWVWTFAAIILFLLLVLVFKSLNWHHEAHVLREEKKLPKDILEKLDELKKYREKYGAKALVAIFMIISLFASHSVKAEVVELTPPLITSYSKDISNKEIFYVGGKTDLINETVILFLQNLSSGETISESVESDKNGNWFYRHNGFLTPAIYRLWTESKNGEVYSPPSPQKLMTVTQTAVVFGQNRLSYEAIYLGIVIFLLILIAGLIILIVFYTYHGHRKRKIFATEVREAEESIGRGFAVLRRDIEAELSIVRRAQMSESLSVEEREKEVQLLADLTAIQKHIGKEIWEMGQENNL